MVNSLKTSFTQNTAPITKDNNFKLFKKIITAMYFQTFSSTILQEELDDIIDEYSKLRDKLKKQMYQISDISIINKKNLDIHKISACLTLAIYRKLKTIPSEYIKNKENIDYIRTTFGYTISLFLLEMYIEKVKDIKLKENMPIYNFNNEISYEEYLLAYIYNNESNIEKKILSMIFSLIKIIEKCQNIN